MRIKDVRRSWKTANQRLNRARQLYAAVTYQAFLKCPLELRDKWMDYLADTALRHGYWSDGYGKSESRRHVRYALVRRWWKMTPGYEERPIYDFPDSWSGWSRFRSDYAWKAVSFRSYAGSKVPELQRAA